MQCVQLRSQNECSFVSLRDVERAMIVLEYFYEKMDKVFAPLIDRRGREEYEELYVVDTDDYRRGREGTDDEVSR